MTMSIHTNIALVAKCVGCGCTDLQACWDGKQDETCHWLRVDRNLGLGVCSCCANRVQAWDTGDYDPRTRIGPTDV